MRRLNHDRFDWSLRISFQNLSLFFRIVFVWVIVKVFPIMIVNMSFEKFVRATAEEFSENAHEISLWPTTFSAACSLF
jgi:hypothetical protein